MNLSDYRKKLVQDGVEFNFQCAEYIQTLKTMEEQDEHRHIYMIGQIAAPFQNGEEEPQGDLIDLTFVIHSIQRYNYEDEKNGIPIEDRIPIKLIINSSGGDAFSTNVLIRMMKISKTPIITINAGMAYSAAGVILMAGHKRYAMPGSFTLIHSGYVSCSGTKEQVESQQKIMKALDDQMKSFILNNTKISQKKYDKEAPKDWYLTDDQQVENGVVDAILDDLSLIY